MSVLKRWRALTAARVWRDVAKTRACDNIVLKMTAIVMAVNILALASKHLLCSRSGMVMLAM